MAFSEQMPAWFFLTQPFFGTTTTSTDRYSASGSGSFGEIQMNQAVDAASLRAVPVDCYGDVFQEMATKWCGEEAIFQPPGIESQQSQQSISPKELGLMNPNYQLLKVAEADAVPHTPEISTLTTTSPTKIPKIRIVKFQESAAVDLAIIKQESSTVGAVPDKRYKCPFCSYASDKKEKCSRHVMTHTGEKPFQCFVCYKQFSRTDHCKKHFCRMHKDTPYDLKKIKKSTAEQVNKDAATVLNSNITAGKTVVSQQDHVMQQGSTTESQVYPIFTVPQQRQSRPAAAAQVSSYKNQFGRMRRDNLKNAKKTMADQVNKNRNVNKSTSIATTVGTKKSQIVQQLSTTVPTPTSTFEVKPSQVVPLYKYLANQQQHLSRPVASSSSGSVKKKKEKIYACNFCSWKGKENLHLKSHLATHI